jgi:Domain of unknown function (DUF397)
VVNVDKSGQRRFSRSDRNRRNGGYGPQSADSVQWRKSSHSAANGNCVEVAELGATIGVRDSKAGAGSPVLKFPPAAWAAFLADVKSREH